MSLNFDHLRNRNKERSEKYFPDAQKWTLLEKAGEMAGEAGEAVNIAKKLRRGMKSTKHGLRPYNQKEIDKLVDEFADELADVIITCDLCAQKLDIDLGKRVIKKFNEKSKQWRSDIFMEEFE